MHAWEQIQTTLDYIDGHLDECPDIDKLARLASLSPFYYQRLFKRLVSKPVAEYIKLRRMAKALDLLPRGGGRILDVALALGFSSHEHFTRCFRETFGITPEDYRRSPRMLNHMTKPELLLRYALIDEGVPLITDGIVLEVNRRTLDSAEAFLGLSADIPLAQMDGLGVDSGEDPMLVLWDRLHAEKDSIAAIDADGDELGVTYASENEGFFAYFAGARAREDTPPEGYRAWRLAVGECVVCSFEAENFDALVTDALYKATQYLFNIWLPKHALATEPYCAERYHTHGEDTTCMELWVKVTGAPQA